MSLRLQLFFLYHLYDYFLLTQLEYYIMGEKYKDGFLYRLINPIIKVPENYFDKYLYIVHIIFITTLIYQLYL